MATKRNFRTALMFILMLMVLTKIIKFLLHNIDNIHYLNNRVIHLVYVYVVYHQNKKNENKIQIIKRVIWTFNVSIVISSLKLALDCFLVMMKYIEMMNFFCIFPITSGLFIRNVKSTIFGLILFILHINGNIYWYQIYYIFCGWPKPLVIQSLTILGVLQKNSVST